MKPFKKWISLFAFSLVLFLDNVNDTSPNLALPSLVNSFGGSITLSQWVINAYMLTSAALLILGGQLGDRWGHKNIFLVGLVVFTAASFLLSFAWSINSLIALRSIQGIGFALTFPTVIILVRNLFNPNQLPMAMALIAGTVGISLAIGPSIGGMLLEHGGWPAIFLFNVPIAVISGAIILCTVNDIRIVNSDAGIYYKETSLLILTTSALTIIINNFSYMIHHAYIFGFLLLSIGLLIYLYRRVSLRIPYPIFGKDFFSIPNYFLSILIRMFTQGVLFSILFILSLTMQNIYQFSVTKTSSMFLFMTVPMAVFSFFVGRICEKFDPAWVVRIGLLLLLCSCILFSYNSFYTSSIKIPIYLALVGFGASFLLPSINTIALKDIPKNRLGTFTGAYYALALFSGTLCIGLSGQFLSLRAKWLLKKVIDVKGLQLTSSEVNHFITSASGSGSINYLAKSSLVLKEDMQEAIRSIFFINFDTLFFILSCFVGVAFILSFLLRTKLINKEEVELIPEENYS